MAIFHKWHGHRSQVRWELNYLILNCSCQLESPDSTWSHQTQSLCKCRYQHPRLMLLPSSTGASSPLQRPGLQTGYQWDRGAYRGPSSWLCHWSLQNASWGAHGSWCFYFWGNSKLAGAICLLRDQRHNMRKVRCLFGSWRRICQRCLLVFQTRWTMWKPVLGQLYVGFARAASFRMSRGSKVLLLRQNGFGKWIHRVGFGYQLEHPLIAGCGVSSVELGHLMVSNVHHRKPEPLYLRQVLMFWQTNCGRQNCCFGCLHAGHYHQLSQWQ